MELSAGTAVPQLSLLITSASLSPMREQQLDPPQKERLGAALAEMDRQLRKLVDTPWLCQPLEPSDEEVGGIRGAAARPLLPVESVLCASGTKVMPVCLESSLVKCLGERLAAGRSRGWYENDSW